MMKQATIKRINKLVINYLSIIGLCNDKQLNEDNPIVIYFMTNILLNKPFIPIKNEKFSIEGDLNSSDEFLTLDIPKSFFHIMIKELYDIYEKLDDINNNQNQEIREILINFVGSEHSFNEYINNIMYQYKDSFYELVKTYNSYNPDYNSMKIKILNDKINECIQEEDYEEAAIIRDKIKSIKENGK